MTIALQCEVTGPTQPPPPLLQTSSVVYLVIAIVTATTTFRFVFGERGVR